MGLLLKIKLKHDPVVVVHMHCIWAATQCGPLTGAVFTHEEQERATVGIKRTRQAEIDFSPLKNYSTMHIT